MSHSPVHRSGFFHGVLNVDVELGVPALPAAPIHNAPVLTSYVQARPILRQEASTSVLALGARVDTCS